MRSTWKPTTKTSHPLTARPMILSDETRIRVTRRGTRRIVRTWVPA